MSRILISGVTVVDVRTGNLSPDRELVLDGGLITAVADAGATPRHDDDRVIEPGAVFVVPGYVDAHAHALNERHPEGTLELMLAHGITGFRQMWGSDDLTARRAAGTLPMPVDSPALLALPGEILSPVNAATPEQATATVRAQHAAGVDFIKIAAAGAEPFAAAQREARRLGLPIAGHLPAATDPRDTARLGFTIEHLGPGIPMLAACSTDEDEIRAALRGQRELRLPRLPHALLKRIMDAVLRRVVVNPVAISSADAVALVRRAIDTFDEAKARDLARLFVAEGTWITPTLIRQLTSQLADAPARADDPDLRYMTASTLATWRTAAARFATKFTPEQHAVFAAQRALEQRLVKILDEEGVRMLTGTDATGAGWIVPGASLHHEFDLLADAGLPPLRILQMATLDAAEFLGIPGGTVEAGMPADFVLLGADPTAGAANLHAVAGIVRAGRYLDAAALDALKEKVAGARSAV